MDTRGLVDKYQVHRNDGKPLKGGGAIVLEVGDPKTWPAIAKLADSVEAAGNAMFASELRAMLDSMGALRSLERYRDEQQPQAVAVKPQSSDRKGCPTNTCSGSLYDAEVHGGVVACPACRFARDGLKGSTGMVPQHHPLGQQRSHQGQRMGLARQAAYESLYEALRRQDHRTDAVYAWGAALTRVCFALGMQLSPHECFHPLLGADQVCPDCGWDFSTQDEADEHGEVDE